MKYKMEPITKEEWIARYWTPDHRHRDLIIDIMRKHPSKNILEIGCVCGANLFRIKKEFPEMKVAGCDISEDAILAAKLQFKANKHFLKEAKEKPDYDYEEHPIQREKREIGEMFLRKPYLILKDIELKTGGIEEIPFHGESFDLVLTDALLIHISPDKIRRALWEIRRVGYNKMIFVELHSKSWWKRWRLKKEGYYAYDYETLLSKYHFKYIKINKIPKEIWPESPWVEFGFIITCIR